MSEQVQGQEPAPQPVALCVYCGLPTDQPVEIPNGKAADPISTWCRRCHQFLLDCIDEASLGDASSETNPDDLRRELASAKKKLRFENYQIVKLQVFLGQMKANTGFMTGNDMLAALDLLREVAEADVAISGRTSADLRGEIRAFLDRLAKQAETMQIIQPTPTA